MKHHNLKSFTKQFQHVVDGFEYTGRSVSARISYIDDFGCQHGYVNLSLSDVGLLYADSAGV